MVFVFFHAHPDDEAVGTAGTMSALAEAGHRVVAVFATGGERGLRPDGVDDEKLAETRTGEAERAAALLGVHQVHLLGYADSGDTPGEHGPGSFVAADPDEAAERLAELVEAAGADTLISYEQSGVTEHPDHLRVHLVGRRAHARLSGVRLYEGAMGESQRDEFGLAIDALIATLPGPAPEPGTAGRTLRALPDEQLAISADVRRWLPQKRAALAAHASQIDAGSFFLTLDEDRFARVFGRESYIDPLAGQDGPGPLETALGDLGVLR